MTVDELLDTIVQRLGGADALRQIRITEAEGQVSFAELNGRFHAITDSSLPHYRHHIDMGAFKQSSGANGNVLWFQDGNGKIHTTTDAEAIAEATVHARFDSDAYLFDREQYQYHLEESETELVLTVTAREYADQPFATAQIVVDPAEILIVRRHVVKDGHTATSHYEDYRELDGVLSAWRILDIDAAGNETTTIIESLRYNPAVDETTFDPPEDEVHDYIFLNGGNTATVPLRIPIEHIYTDVIINGRKYEFIVDTGAGKTLIALDVAEELGLEKIATIKGQGVSGVHEAVLVSIPEMIVGEVKMTEQQVIAMDLTDLRKRIPEVSGLIGMDFLNRFVVRFDYVQSEMTVFDRDSFRYEGEGEYFSLHGIDCIASFDGHQGKHSVDTGAGSYNLYAPFVRKHNLVRNPDKMPRSSAISGIGSVELVNYEALCHEFRLGKFVLKDVPVGFSEIDSGAFANESVVGNIGGPIWRRFISYFDFTANTMILEPNSNFDEPFTLYKLGAGFRQEDSRILVDSVTTHTPAAEVGLERGDELLMVDGTPASEFSLDDLRRKWRGAEGTHYRLTVLKTSGERSEIHVELRNYLRYYDDY